VSILAVKRKLRALSKALSEQLMKSVVIFMDIGTSKRNNRVTNKIIFFKFAKIEE